MTVSITCRINTRVKTLTLMTDLYCRIERNQDKTSALSLSFCPWTQILAGATKSRLLIPIHTYITIISYMFPDFMSHDREIITQEMENITCGGSVAKGRGLAPAETLQSFNKSFTSGPERAGLAFLLRGQ